MNWPPIGWTPGKSIAHYYNGSPARSADIRDIDREATWLACHKYDIPVMVANYFKSTAAGGGTYTIDVRIPPFTRHVAVSFECTGSGTIVVTNDDDTYNTSTKVWASSSSTHSYADAQWVQVGPGLESAGSHGLDRAIDVDFLDSNGVVHMTWAITDHSAAQDLRVYAVRIRPLWPDETADLATAT